MFPAQILSSRSDLVPSFDSVLEMVRRAETVQKIMNHEPLPSKTWMEAEEAGQPVPGAVIVRMQAHKPIDDAGLDHLK
jgi:hypothetical protein